MPKKKGGDPMSFISTLTYRLRLKVKDTDAITYSKYDVLDAMKEALRELRKTVVQFYSHLNFTVPATADVTEASETGWPVEFDELLIEYAVISLANGDYNTKEQAKMLWKQKVLSLASTMDAGVDVINGMR